MKVYKGYELMQAVIEGKLSLQQRVSSIDSYYNNCTIEFVLKDAAIHIMDLKFKVIEEKIKELPIFPEYAYKKSDIKENRIKINEIVREVNRLKKEREEK